MPCSDLRVVIAVVLCGFADHRRWMSALFVLKQVLRSVEVVKDRHGTDSIGGGYQCGMVEFSRRCIEICGEQPRRDVATRVVRISNMEFAILVPLTLVALAGS
jgi:hypothetical protein